jgi:F420-dependent oxidoreductase-like protein
VKVGLQIPRFKWPGGPPQTPSTLRDIAKVADEGGFASIWLMDHLFQIASISKPEEDMLEAYTTLGFLAACTARARLGTLVTGVHYRHPGVLIKQVTTLDVLSGGRAWLGIGAGWYERESRGLGVPFPRVGERFERLRETLEIALHMWRGDTSPIYGKHFQLNEPLCSPMPISQPHPPILIGGGGEGRTLRYVARYADACNLFARYGPADVRRKLDTLRAYCDQYGRAYESIDKTVLTQWNVGRKTPDVLLEECRQFAALGFDTVIASFTAVETLKPLEVIARDVIPQAETL